MPPIHDPPDMNELDESDQHREVYAFAGLALYYAQVLEQGVINLIFTARAHDGTLAQDFKTVDDFFDTYAAKTLGGLLRVVSQHVALPPGIEKRSNDALQTRNFLAHHCFKERIDQFLTLHGRQELANELAAMARLFNAADDQLQELTFRFGARFGITAERVARAVEELYAAHAVPGS